ncbi:MAG: trehalose-6-phosphate synthase, partial [Burkholderiaceae bacterium]
MPFRSFRLSLRFILPLALVLALFAYAVMPLVDDLAVRWFVKDLDKSAQVLANSLQDPLQEYVPLNEKEKIAQLFDRAIKDERLHAIALCDPYGKLLYKTSTYPASLGCQPLQRKKVATDASVSTSQGSFHITQSIIKSDTDEYLGKLILLHDMAFIEQRS